MPLATQQLLTGQLLAEYGDALPATLIETTVATAAAPGTAASPQDVARADVAALADAVRRSSAADVR